VAEAKKSYRWPISTPPPNFASLTTAAGADRRFQNAAFFNAIGRVRHPVVVAAGRAKGLLTSVAAK
jgi:hypothetical protein